MASRGREAADADQGQRLGGALRESRRPGPGVEYPRAGRPQGPRELLRLHQRLPALGSQRE
ncbi:hypothetical protein ACRAWD_09980 [Caulobacter segnis]